MKDIYKYSINLLSFSIIIIISISSCNINKQVVPEFDQGITSNVKSWRLPLDSFHLLTPNIEISYIGSEINDEQKKRNMV